MKKALLAQAALAAIACVGMTASVHAAAIWTSNDGTLGDTTLWGNTNNWTGGTPINGDDIEIGIPVAGGSRITSNNVLTQINSLWLKANLNEANGNGVDLLGTSVKYTAGGSSIAYIRMPVNLTQNATYEVSANTSNGRLEVTADISSTGGTYGLTKADAGRLRFTTTAKTYSGDTIVTGGLLDVSADNMLPYGAGKGSLYIGTGAQLAINNVNTQINGLNDYSGSAGAVNKSGSNTRSLTLGNGDANGNFSGSITFSGGSSTVHKVGAGTQTLGGVVSVPATGAGTVSGGWLKINGTWSAGMVVNANGTLGGIGSIAGAVSGAGKLNPGNSIGMLTVGSDSMTGTLVIELDGTGAGSSDLLNVTGDLNINNMSVDFDELVAINDPAYVFAKYGSLTGTAFLNELNVPAGYEIDYAYDNGVSTNNIALVVVPEPSTLGAIAGMTLLGLRRRR